MIKFSDNKNLETVRRMFTAFNNRELDEWSNYIDEETIDMVPPGKSTKGLKAIQEGNEQFIKGIPDVQYELTNVFGQDSLVCVEGIVKGTNVGSEKSFQVPISVVITVENEKIREVHWYMNPKLFQV